MIKLLSVRCRLGNAFIYSSTFTALVSLIACDNSAENSAVRYIGFVELGEYKLPEGMFDLYLDGNFLVYNRNINKELAILFDIQNGLVNSSEDECRSPGSTPGSLNTGVQVVSAGENVIFTDENGTYATLFRDVEANVDETYIDYELILRSVPSPEIDLYIDIPGDEFTSFDKIKMPNAFSGIALTAQPVAGDPLTDLEYTWAPNLENSYLRLTFHATQDDVDGLEIITCEVVDDGSFILDESVTNQLSDYSKLELVRSMAVADWITIKDETLLITRRELELAVLEP